MKYPLEDLNLLVLNAGYAVHDGDWNWKDVSSPFTRIYLVTQGTAQIQMPTGLYTLEPGHLYCIPSFVKHSDICSEHFEHYYLHVYEDGNAANRIFEDWNFPFETTAADLDELLFRRLCALNPQMKLSQSNPTSYDNSSGLLESIRLNKSREFSNMVESRGIVYLLVSRFLGNAQPKDHSSDDRISHALSMIRKNISEPIDFDKIVETSCMSRDHFIRVFHRETGETPMRYIIRLKVERAQLLLTTSDMSVKQVALQLGYFDHSYFNRLFKKEVGVTPMQYRERNKK